MQKKEISNIISKYKLPITFALLIFIILIALMIATQVRYISKQPWLTYGNITWTNDSKEIIYTRESISPEIEKNYKKIFEIRKINVETQKQKLLASLDNDSSSIKLIKCNPENDKIYFTKIENRKPQLYYCKTDGSKIIEKINIPSENIENLIQDGDDIIFSESINNKEKNRDEFKIKIYNSVTNEIEEIFNTFSDANSIVDNYKLINGDISPDKKFYCIGIWHQTEDNLEGKTSFLVYDKDTKILKTTEIVSYESNIKFEISKNSETVAIKTFAVDKDGIKKPLLHFYNLLNKTYKNCFIGNNIDPNFTIIQSNDGKTLLKTDDKIYLVIINGSVISVKMIFDRETIPFPTDEFNISPSGKKIALIRYAKGRNLKSELRIANIDGTNCIELITPEGRRTMEGNPFYIYLRYCKLVVIDFIQSIK